MTRRRLLYPVSLIVGALCLTPQMPAQARGTRSTPDIVGEVELTVRADVTGRYAEEGRQRGAGAKAPSSETHTDGLDSYSIVSVIPCPHTAELAWWEQLLFVHSPPRAWF